MTLEPYRNQNCRSPWREMTSWTSWTRIAWTNLVEPKHSMSTSSTKSTRMTREIIRALSCRKWTQRSILVATAFPNLIQSTRKTRQWTEIKIAVIRTASKTIPSILWITRVCPLWLRQSRTKFSGSIPRSSMVWVSSMSTLPRDRRRTFILSKLKKMNRTKTLSQRPLSGRMSWVTAISAAMPIMPNRRTCRSRN